MSNPGNLVGRQYAHALVFPRMTLSGTLSVTKSSKEGPSSSVRLKVDFELDGVARQRT